jgi:hypothetical protein
MRGIADADLAPGPIGRGESKEGSHMGEVVFAHVLEGSLFTIVLSERSVRTDFLGTSF